MKHVLIAIGLSLFSTLLMAQNNSKFEKRLLKSLKKEYKLSDARYVREKGDGYKYIYLRTKDWHPMIADSLGKLIIPNTYPTQNHYEKIEYIPSRSREYGTKYVYGVPNDYLYLGNQACFFTEQHIGYQTYKYCFYDLKGIKLSDFSGKLYKDNAVDAYLATYIPTDSLKEFRTSSVVLNNEGLLAKDGKILIPTVYSKVTPCNKGFCYVEKNEGGIKKKGIINLSDSTYTDVPCIFNEVILSEKDNTWLVRMHELDTLSAYSPDSVYPCTYADEGEKLYESEKYEEARKYYLIEHNDALFANAYIGACCWKFALDNLGAAKIALGELGRVTNENGHDDANSAYDKLDVFERESNSAMEYFDLYLQGECQKYKPRIKEIRYELSKLVDEANVLRNSVERELEAYKYRREAYLKEKHLEQIKQENERIYQQEQLRIAIQKQHEINERNRIINERNRIALERQRARKRAEEKKKSEEKKKAEAKQTVNRGNGTQNNSRWRNVGTDMPRPRKQ